MPVAFAPRYAPLALDLSRLVVVNLPIPALPLPFSGDRTLLLEVLRPDSKLLFSIDLGNFLPTIARISDSQSRKILEIKPATLNNCKFVVLYRVLAKDSHSNQKTLLLSGPLTIDTGCRELQWISYLAENLARLRIAGHYEPGQTKALPFDPAKASSYTKGTIVVNSNGHKFISLCDAPTASPPAADETVSPDEGVDVDVDSAEVSIEQDSPSGE